MQGEPCRFELGTLLPWARDNRLSPCNCFAERYVTGAVLLQIRDNFSSSSNSRLKASSLLDYSVYFIQRIRLRFSSSCSISQKEKGVPSTSLILHFLHSLVTFSSSYCQDGLKWVSWNNELTPYQKQRPFSFIFCDIPGHIFLCGRKHDAQAYKGYVDSFQLCSIEQYGEDPFLFQHDNTPGYVHVATGEIPTSNLPCM